MKFLKIFKLVVSIFLVATFSLQAQKAKKGKKKEPAKTIVEKKNAPPQELEEKEIEVKKQDAELIQKESAAKNSVAKEEVNSIPEAKNAQSRRGVAEPVREGPQIMPASSVKEPTVNPITLNQYFSNDIWFRGFSVLGNKLSQRDNMAYDSIPQAWNVVTGVAYNPTENITIGMNVYSPTAHRANRDTDYFMQSGYGNRTDFTDQFLTSAQTNNPNYFIDYATRKGADPTSIQMRKEKNGLKDIFDASFTHKYNTRFGKIVTGAYIANNDNYNITLGELVAGIEFAFLKAINPAYTSYYRVSSEGGGGGNGTSNHRLSISHTFFADKEINFTSSLAAGYQYHNNLSDYRSGVSDVTPKLQINYGSFYFSILDMIRPDSSLWDTSGGFGSGGAFKDTNRRDGRVEDPSKVNGINNKFAVDQINKGVNDFHSANAGADPNGYGREALREHLTHKYQTQKFVTHIFHFTIGYSLKF